jgi:hypothetical protein
MLRAELAMTCLRVCAGRPRAASSPETSTEKMDRASLPIEHFISFAETFADVACARQPRRDERSWQFKIRDGLESTPLCK